jgi:transcription termination factor Rho
LPIGKEGRNPAEFGALKSGKTVMQNIYHAIVCNYEVVMMMWFSCWLTSARKVTEMQRSVAVPGHFSSETCAPCACGPKCGHRAL